MADVYSKWSDTVQFGVAEQKPFSWEVVEIQKFLSGEPVANQGFGFSVSMNGAGTMAMVSTSRIGTVMRGTIYHFTKVNGVWTYLTKIEPNASHGLGFGIKIALNSEGTALLVGSMIGVGHVYYYAFEAGAWVMKQDIYDPASGGSSEYGFGTAVAISGDGTTAMIGAWRFPVDGKSGAGCVYVYSFNGMTWSLQKQLLPPTPTAGAGFGYSVAISGNGLCAAIGLGDWETIGKLLIYNRSGTTWATANESFNDGTGFSAYVFPANNTKTNFGRSVAMNRDGSLLFSSYYNEDSNGVASGCVIVFIRIYKEYREAVRIYGSDEAMNDNFGYSVSTNLTGDLLLVGSPYNDDTATATGSMYFFDTSALLDRLQETNKIYSDPITAARIGSDVCLSADGKIALIGAYNDTGSVEYSGGVTYFTREQGVWTKKGKFFPDDPVTSAGFGVSVAMNAAGDRAVIGCYMDSTRDVEAGAVYTFSRTGDVWTQTGKIVPHAISDWVWERCGFGYSVALDASGTELLVGVPFAGGTPNGCVFAYRLVNNIWTYYTRFFNGNVSGNHFGSGIAISPDGLKAIVGSDYSDYVKANSGGAHICKRVGNTWTVGAAFYPPDLLQNSHFGKTASVNEDFTMAAIGAYQDGPNSEGSVYLYSIKNNVPTLKRKIRASDAGVDKFFGFSVCLTPDGRNMLVGAQGEDLTNVDQGAFYEFVSINQF